jgi:hypothetical protein
MMVIRPNCRVRFSAEDIEFILAVLGPKTGSRGSLLQLLGDPESLGHILDDETLLRAVLEHPNCLRISAHFYFYILVRHSFRRAGLVDLPMTDYVAAVLAEFSHQERTRCRVKGSPVDYFVDMLAALQTADEATSFYIRAHIGNQSLFLSGVFPDRLRFRMETRGAPGLTYYEGLGRTNFRVASDHPLARQYDLDDIFSKLAERFQETRMALNDLRDRLVALGDADVSNLLIHPHGPSKK